MKKRLMIIVMMTYIDAIDNRSRFLDALLYHEQMVKDQADILWKSFILRRTSNVVANSKVEASLIRLLESQSLGDYVSGLEKLDIVLLSNLLSLTNSQLIEVALQLDMKPLKTVLFVEAIISNKEYTQRHTINEVMCCFFLLLLLLFFGN